MPIRVSSGFVGAVTTVVGVQSLMQYGTINVYSGAQPDSADLAPTGTLLGSITQDGLAFQPGYTYGGLYIISPTSGVLQKSGVWRLKGVASGTAGYWRWLANVPDDGTENTTSFRIDGDFTNNFYLANTSITAATDTEILDFTFTLLKQE